MLPDQAFLIEEGFLDDKSAGFQLETSEIRSTDALARLALAFGMKMIFSNPEKQAAFIEEQTGIPTKAAFDGMIATIDEKQITFSNRNDKKKTLSGLGQAR
jgi:hypothetical protein